MVGPQSRFRSPGRTPSDDDDDDGGRGGVHQNVVTYFVIFHLVQNELNRKKKNVEKL